MIPRLIRIAQIAQLALAVCFAGCGDAPSDDSDVASTGEEITTRKGNKAEIDGRGVLHVNRKPVFPIGFTTAPPATSIAPSGKNGLAELRAAGGNFVRSLPLDSAGWTDAAIARERTWEDAAASHGFYCWLWLHEASSFPSPTSTRAARMRHLVKELGSHPCMAVWKGADEPQHGGVPPAEMRQAYDLLKTLDGRHPLTVIQAPVGTLSELYAYKGTSDITGFDMYPVGEPMGAQTDRPNKTLSIIGDLEHTARQLGTASTWMTLQISWSGVDPARGKPLMFPTRHQERFMVYDAIINGARGLFFFGGQNTFAWQNAFDKQQQWAWKFWDDVLKPVVEEIGENSPLHPALIGDDSVAAIRVAKGAGIEFLARRSPGELFIIAANKASVRAQEPVTLDGIPFGPNVDVLYEGRKLALNGGRLTDTFEPYAVHVYRIPVP